MSDVQVLQPLPLFTRQRNCSVDSAQTLIDMAALAADIKAPIASTSAAPYAPAATNGKGKAVEQPTYVDLPNSAPRSYTILKEVGDGSFGTVWLADWHSPLECVPSTLPLRS
jgi:hypothetical protein